MILELIKELAHFENADDSVKATEVSLGQTLNFAPSEKDQDSAEDSSTGTQSELAMGHSTSGYAKTLLLSAPEGEVAGMALYFHNYSTWRAKPGIYLEDLYVRPKYRRRGYATLLLKELAKEVQKINGGRLEWACLKWNENALKFYRSQGAATMDEWVGLRVDGENLAKLAGYEVG